MYEATNDLTAPPAPTRPPAPRSAVRWQRGPVADAVLCGLWLPFAALAAAVGSNPDRLAMLVAATLTFSFAHQPLTLWLVYGDMGQLASRRWLFILSPPAMLAAVVFGLTISPVLVTVIAAGWNVAHTLRQRYGIVRIYGRLAGQSDGTGEQAMLWSWLALAVATALSNSGFERQLAQSGLAGRNRSALDALAAAGSAAPLLILLTGVAAVWCSARWARREADRVSVNPAKWVYLASTAALFLVIAVHPAAGFVGYVGSHAAEYVLLVHRRLGGASRSADSSRGALFSVVRATGPTAFLVAYAVGVAVLVIVLDRFTSNVANVVLLTLGGLHLFQDGFIWKLRRSEVAARLGIPPASATSNTPTR